MTKGTDIVKTEGGLLALFQERGVKIEEVAAAVSEAVGSGSLRMSDLERIRLPAGGGTTWTIQGIDGDVETKELIAAIIGDIEIRAFWKNAYSGGTSPPDCFSRDCETGIGEPGGACETCPNAKFGTRVRPDGKQGKGQACSQRRQLMLFMPDSALPRMLSAPPSSLNRVRRDFVRAAARGIRASRALWAFTLTKEQSSDGIPYSAIEAKPIRKLTPEELILVEDYQRAVQGLEPTKDIVSPDPEE